MDGVASTTTGVSLPQLTSTHQCGVENMERKYNLQKVHFTIVVYTHPLIICVWSLTAMYGIPPQKFLVVCKKCDQFGQTFYGMVIILLSFYDCADFPTEFKWNQYLADPQIYPAPAYLFTKVYKFYSILHNCKLVTMYSECEPYSSWSQRASTGATAVVSLFPILTMSLTGTTCWWMWAVWSWNETWGIGSTIPILGVCGYHHKY